MCHRGQQTVESLAAEPAGRGSGAFRRGSLLNFGALLTRLAGLAGLAGLAAPRRQGRICVVVAPQMGPCWRAASASLPRRRSDVINQPQRAARSETRQRGHSGTVGQGTRFKISKSRRESSNRLPSSLHCSLQRRGASLGGGVCVRFECRVSWRTVLSRKSICLALGERRPAPRPAPRPAWRDCRRDATLYGQEIRV